MLSFEEKINYLEQLYGLGIENSIQVKYTIHEIFNYLRHIKQQNYKIDESDKEFLRELNKI